MVPTQTQNPFQPPVQNPLQEFYRQPKIYVSLPSQGIFNKVGSLTGDLTNTPIYGMTGMDQIMMKTPDALLTGETTVALLESCCPGVKDGWEVNALDIDLLLTAIRIATYGNDMAITHTCKNPECKATHDYDIDLGMVIGHFAKCKYERSLVYNGLTINLQPLTYRITTDLSIRNFELQQRLHNAKSIEDAEEQKSVVAQVFKELGMIQNEIYTNSIESIDTGKTVVTERRFIADWLRNSDKQAFDTIRDHFNTNKASWKIPTVTIACSVCNTTAELEIDLDQANFFASA